MPVAVDRAHPGGIGSDQFEHRAGLFEATRLALVGRVQHRFPDRAVGHLQQGIDEIAVSWWGRGSVEDAVESKRSRMEGFSVSPADRAVSASCTSADLYCSTLSRISAGIGVTSKG